MSILNRAKIKKVLKNYNIRPNKGLGQNFLTSEAAVKKIINGAELKPEDTVLEIGPGLGALTQPLSEQAKQVIAVEKDARLVKALQESLKPNNIELVQQDFLEADLQQLMPESFKVVSALPYSSAAAIIRKLLEQSSPQSMVVTVQKEVGQRIVAEPPNMSVLAVATQVYGKPEIVGSISNREFWPQPKINSSILKITDILPPDHEFRNKSFNKNFFKVVKAGFAHSRKKLINSLSLELETNKQELKQRSTSIDLSQRAETLTVEQWLKLSKELKALH